MLSDWDALLAAIRANPDEDTPRLVFADWLDENGEAARAEFVRGQCEFARLEDEHADSYAMYAFLRARYPVGLAATDWARVDVGVQRLIDLEARADALLKRHGKAWLPKVGRRGLLKWDGFRRGFPHRVWFNSDAARDLNALPDLAPRLRGACPPVILQVYDALPRILGRLPAGALDWVAGVSTGAHAGLRDLGHRPEARHIRTLTVTNLNHVDDAAALDAPNWTGLHTLDLSDGLVYSETAEALFRLNNLRTLRRLRVRGYDGWTAEPVRALAAGGFVHLTSLHLTGCDLNDAAAEALADCPDLANLRDFDLSGNRITGRGATALLCSPHLANLANLCLDGNPCTGLDAGRLAAARPAALRLLHFHGSRLRAADVRALAGSPRLRTLWYLDLDDNGIGPTAVRALVRGLKDWCPPILWLAYNRIDDRGAGLLANWKAAAGLTALHVKHNGPMTAAGVNALLDSPHLANLTSLGVSATGDAEARLRARFKHPDGY